MIRISVSFFTLLSARSDRKGKKCNTVLSLTPVSPLELVSALTRVTSSRRYCTRTFDCRIVISVSGDKQYCAHSTVQYSTVQYSTVQYSTVQYSTVQYSTVQYSAVQYSTVQCCTVQYSTVQYSTVQYSTVQYSTVQYSTVQYSTVQYSTVLYVLSPVACPSFFFYFSFFLPLIFSHIPELQQVTRKCAGPTSISLGENMEFFLPFFPDSFLGGSFRKKMEQLLK